MPFRLPTLQACCSTCQFKRDIMIMLGVENKTTLIKGPDFDMTNCSSMLSSRTPAAIQQSSLTKQHQSAGTIRVCKKNTAAGLRTTSQLSSSI